MYLESIARQTAKWQLKGATYLQDKQFHFVGDLINGETQLIFDVNGETRTVAVPEPLKQLKEYYDEVKNGVVHYNIKKFEVNEYTILTYDPSWLQTPETAVCYCHLPYDARSNTPILCDKLDVINDMITRTQSCGVKVINKVLAIRLPIQDLGITTDDSKEEFLNKFNLYIKENPFAVLYCLEQTQSHLLKNYSFSLKESNNDITCKNQYDPSYFFVDYPIDVIINTNVNIKEIQEIAKEIKETKKLIDEIKKELDEKSNQVNELYKEIIQIQEKVNQQNEEINRLYSIIIEAEKSVSASLITINNLKDEITQLANEIQEIANNIESALIQHNQDKNSHEDIRLQIQRVSESIIFDFGAY